MQNQSDSNFRYDPNGYRNEGNQPPKKPSTKPVTPQPYDPGESESPEMSMSHEESSPFYEVTPSYAESFQYTPAQPKKPQQPHVHYEMEEETIEINKILFSAHPMHKCPTLCEYIKDCMLHCQRTMHVLMCRPDAYQRSRQIAILQDCAEVCHLTTCQVARRSPILRTTLRYCAKVCRICAEESMRHPDPESQMSAKMCLQCADVCEKFVQYQNWNG